MEYQYLEIATISFAVVGKHFIRQKHIKIFKMVQKSNGKTVSKEAAEQYH